MKNRRLHKFLTSLLAALLPAFPLTVCAADQQAIPDFTKGDQPGEAHDWTLGPTGARGWIYSATTERTLKIAPLSRLTI